MKRNITESVGSDEVSGDQDQPSQKRKRTSRFEGAMATDSYTSISNGIPSSQNIQELLATTKKQIEERKKQTQVLLAHQKLPASGLLPTPDVPPMNIVHQAAEHVMSSAMSEAVEKAKRAAEVGIFTKTNA